MTNTTAAELHCPLEPTGVRPEGHELRGRQHLREGHRDRPGDGPARRAAVGQGLRRRPRHADRVRSRRASTRRAARPGERVSRASSAKTRWSPRSTTPCSARAARPRRSTPPCTDWWMRRTSTTCIRMPGSRSRLRPTARNSPPRRSAARSPGFRGVAPASSSDSTSPRSRRPTRTRSGASWAATASPRGATPATRQRRTASGSSTPRRSTSTPTGARIPLEPPWPVTAPCPQTSGARRPPPLPRTCASIASEDKPQVGSFTDADVVLDFLASVRASAARRAGHELPRPLPAHQGQAHAARPSRGRLDRGLDRPARRAARAVPRRLPGLLRRPRDVADSARDPRRRPADHPDPGRRHVQLRRQQADRARRRRVLHQRHQRHARCRGPLDLHAHLGCREVPHRVLGTRRGQAAADAETQAARGTHRARHRSRIRNRQGHRDPSRGGGRVRRHRRPRPRQGAGGRRRTRATAMSRSESSRT